MDRACDEGKATMARAENVEGADVSEASRFDKFGLGCWGVVEVTAPKGPIDISKPDIVVPVFEGWGEGFVAAEDVHVQPAGCCRG